MSLPIAVHHRLDVLADSAKAVNPSRAEIIGALVAEAGLESEKLERLIVAYRKKTVGDVVPADPAQVRQNLYSIETRGPGRPARPKRAEEQRRPGTPVVPWEQWTDESA